MTGLTAEEKIIKAVIRLQKEKPFWAYLMLHLNKTKMSDKMKAQMIASGSTPTMAVDMKGNLYFADEFVDSLSQEELKGVIAHEVIHLAFTHLARLGQRDMNIWNVACDLVANDMLITDGFTLPKGCLNPTHDHTFKFANCEIKDIHDKSAEIIYNEFPRNPKGSKGSGKGKGGKGSGESDDELKNFDQHIFGDGSGKDGMGKGKGKKLSQAQVDRIKKNWEKKLTEAVTFAKQRGVLPAGMERRLDELLNSKVSWKEKLYKYITNQIPHDYTWSRPSRKSRALGVYLPDTLKENLNITVAIDVSGSIGDKEYQEFISEMVGISKSFENVVMNCLFWDTEVTSDLVMKNGNIKIIEETKVCGYGGTTFNCVSEYLRDNRKKPNLMVVFTDGYIDDDYAKPECKTLWVITERGSSEICKKREENYIELKGGKHNEN